jgi:hypothetical protein
MAGSNPAARRARRVAAAVALASAAAVLPSAPATAAAAAPGALWTDARQVDFGWVTVGSNTTRTVRIANAGPSAATGISFSTVVAPFARTATTCGASLAAGTTCTVTLRYQPTSSSPASGDLVISSAEGGANRVQLFGRPDRPVFPLAVTSSRLDFGPTAVGTTANSQAVRIRNTDTVSRTFTLSGVTPTGPFSVFTNSCGPAPKVLAAGATCDVAYRFSPTAAGPATGTATFAVAVSGGETRTFPVDLAGRGGTSGAYPITATQTRLDFGRVALGTTAPSQSVVLRNTSAAPVTFSLAGGAAGDFGGSSSCGGGSLAPGNSCALSYAPNLSAPGFQTRTTGITLNVPGVGSRDVDFLLTAHGVGNGPRLHATVPLADLGPVPTGTTSPLATVASIVNSGTGAVTVTGFEVTGSPRFTITRSCTTGIVAGGGCEIRATYAATDQQPAFAQATLRTTVGDHTVVVAAGPPSGVHERFVTAAHLVFLGRSPTNAELSSLAASLDAGTRTRRQVISGLANSPEWIGAVVQRLYQDTLGRAGDPGGVRYWTNQLRSGRRTVAQVAAEFYASSEYYRTLGGNTDPSWVSDLYVKLLGRSPDPGGLSYWVGQTRSRGRVSVAFRMFQSSESARTRVTRLYQELLERGTDPSGRDFWARRVVTQGDIVLAIELASSGEFLRRAQYGFQF